MKSRELEATKFERDTLAEALRALAECPDLYLDNLEPATLTALVNARAALAILKDRNA